MPTITKVYKRYDCDGFANHKSEVNKIHNREKHLIKNTILFFLSANDPTIGPIIATKKPVMPTVHPQYDCPKTGLGAICLAKYVAKMKVIIIVVNAEFAKS